MTILYKIHLLPLEFLCLLDSIAYKNAHFGKGTGYIYLDLLKCTGLEEQVLDCPYKTHVGADTHSEDAGVKCEVLDVASNESIESTYVTVQCVHVYCKGCMTYHATFTIHANNNNTVDDDSITCY